MPPVDQYGVDHWTPVGSSVGHLKEEWGNQQGSPDNQTDRARQPVKRGLTGIGGGCRVPDWNWQTEVPQDFLVSQSPSLPFRFFYR